MRAVLQALLDLQGVDRDLFRVNEELKRLPAERSVKKAELDRATARLLEKRNEQKLLRVRVKELDDHATVQRQRMRKVENEAAGSRSDMALLAAYQHEIKTLKRDISSSEEEGLGLLEKIEGLEAEAAVLQKKLDEDQRTFAEFSANVERELAAAEAKRKALSDERKRRMSKEIPPEALNTYTKLLAAREGMALALLEGRTCQACFMEIPTNLCVRVSRGSELVQCPSCDRILHFAP
jgi:predicted  nucleic acid-binding Zn-ribbon protein